MAKTGSYIKLDRGLKNNALWMLEKPFTKGQAWVDLLLLAQGVDKSREHNGKQQKLKKGNVYTSIYFLSDRWGWSRMKVYRFLEKLMIDGMIVVQGWKIDETTFRTVHRTSNETRNNTTDETTVSIVNWALYQHSETTSDTSNRPVRRATDETSNETHNRKIKERYTEKEKEIPPISPKGDSPPSEKKQRGYPYPCGLYEKPEWMDDDRWVVVREMTADDIPGVHRGEYDDIIEYVHDKMMGCLR